MSTAGALLLTPGAGADRDQATLRAVDDGLKLPVERIDFPYRIAGKRAPDKAPVAVAHVREQAAAFAKVQRIRANRLVLGGRSYGGRMCSMAVAEGLAAAGLVLLSYPLHPPGKPDKLRTEHFPDLHVPCLFVSGRKDPFGSPAEFEQETRAIPGPVELAFVDGTHAPRNKDAEIVALVADWIASLR